MIKNLIFILILTGLAQAQLAFTELDGVRWKINLDHVIIQLRAGTNETQIKEPLAAMNGKIIRPLNNHRFFLISFRNYSNTVEIFGRQINRLRKISQIADVLPVFRYSEKLMSTDVYLNSEVEGFTSFKNDSIFNRINNLHMNFSTCHEEKLRIDKKLVRFAMTEFTIKNGITQDLKFLDTDVEGAELECVRRVLENQLWGNKKYTGRIRFLFVIKNER